MASSSITPVQFLYKRVIDETVKASRETFLNEGIEDSVLQELRTLWESKVAATRAVDPGMNPPDYISRGQIYKYNYNRGGGSSQPVQQQQSSLLGSAGSGGSNTIQSVPFPHVSAFMPQQRPAPRVPQVPLVPQVPQIRPAPQSHSSQYPSTIPFPSMGAAVTVTKKEFNNASDSIQVDGNFPVIELGSCSISNKGKRRKQKKPAQLDGADSDDDVGEFVDSDDSDEDDGDDDTDEEIDVEDRVPNRMLPSGIPEDINEPSMPAEEEEPLNSEDDDSDDENTEFETTDNVVVCLYDKITRSKNKWKLHLKEGVMNIAGKDHVFQKAVGDGEW